MQNVNMVANGKRNSRLNPDDELDVGCTSLNCVCVWGGLQVSASTRNYCVADGIRLIQRNILNVYLNRIISCFAVHNRRNTLWKNKRLGIS